MKLHGFVGLALVMIGSVGFAQEEDTLPVGAVAERSVEASASVESFRPLGEFRLWRFFAKQTTFGELTSAVVDRRDVGGQESLVLREAAHIDFSQIGFENQVSVSGESYVSQAGHFAGCDLKIGPGDAAERLVLEAEDNRLTGYFTRGGSEKDVSQPWKPETFFWDLYLVDQLEIFLAMQDLQIGTIIDDSLFLPQSLMYAPVTGYVASFMWQEIYKGRFDSVFVIRLTQPSAYQLCFTPDKRLIKVDMIDQGIRVYQDLVRRIPAPQEAGAQAPGRPPFSLRLLLFKLPHYVAFVLVAAVAVLFLSARAFRWRGSYLAFLIGIVVYLLMPLVANPVMIYGAENWLDLPSAGGSSVYVRGAVLPLVAGLIQSALILIGLVIIVRMLKPRAYRRVGLGAFVGAGFGLAESVYVSGLQVTYLFTWPLAERASMILLYAVSGALIGRFGRERGLGLAWAVLAAAAVNGAARYLPLLVQGRLVNVEAMHFVLAVWVILYLLLVLVLSRRSMVRIAETDHASPPADQP